jgi:hypothetical protein
VMGATHTVDSKADRSRRSSGSARRRTKAR